MAASGTCPLENVPGKMSAQLPERVLPCTNLLIFTMKIVSFVSVFLLLGLVGSLARGADTPHVGNVAPNFTLRTLEDRPVELNQLTAKGTVLLVVLRGWPGYQCPFCTRQVQELIANAGEFAKTKAQVLMVYPGPAEQLKAHAQEFLGNKQWPENFLFAIDPDYAFTNAYGLRWDAKKETAYPSTFVIGSDRKVRFAHVSKSHGDRVTAAQALAALK